MIALRCAGFNNVALEMAEAFNISTARVPAYSPYAVAEHASALLMTLNRKTHKVWAADRLSCEARVLGRLSMSAAALCRLLVRCSFLPLSTHCPAIFLFTDTEWSTAWTCLTIS
jgi:lactate dehydrogenase-like 2-hydroxyacid dehydrogenase